jgi:hypothetical protein
VNTKSPYIPTSFGGENTGEVNKALRGWEGIILYPEIFPIGCLLVWVLRG